MNAFILRACFCAALILPMIGFTQERTAGGAMDVQMTWTALKNLVEDANAKTEAVGSRVSLIEICGKQGKVYAPGSGKPNGCIEATVTTEETDLTDLKNMITCGNQGKVFNKAKNACVAPEATGGLRWGVTENVTISSDACGGSDAHYINSRSPYKNVKRCSTSAGSPCTTKGAMCWTMSTKYNTTSGNRERTGYCHMPYAIHKCQ